MVVDGEEEEKVSSSVISAIERERERTFDAR